MADVSSPLDTIPHGSAAMVRACIAEALGSAELQAYLAGHHADLDDDAALEHCIRRLIAYTRSAAALVPDLRDAKAREAGRREREAA
jgi:hypothetical protein